MEYTFQLTAGNYLAYHLFTASNSPVIRASRKKNLIFIMGAFLVLAFVYYSKDNQWVMFYFIVCAAAVLLFYSKYAAWAFKRRFQKYIQKHYKDNFGQIVKLRFMPDQLLIESNAGETTFNIPDLEEVNETGSYYFIRSAEGQSVIIPKSSVSNLPAFEQELHQMITQADIYYTKDLNWIWK